MLERILNGSLRISVIAVWITLIGALILYLAAGISLFMAIRDVVTSDGEINAVTKTAAVEVLKTIDLVLIAIGLQIIASGICQLFLKPEFEPPGAMKISSFSELKATVVKVASIVLVIDFLENALDSGPNLEILYYGAAIAIVIIAVAVAIRLEQKPRAGADSTGLSE